MEMSGTTKTLVLDSPRGTLERFPGNGKGPVAHRYDVETLEEGRCVITGPDGTVRKVYVVRRNVDFLSPLGCKHQPGGSGVIKVELPSAAEDADGLLYVAQQEGQSPKIIVLCEECGRSLQGLEECPGHVDGEKTPAAEEAYGYIPTACWSVKGVPSKGAVFDVSKTTIAQMVYHELLLKRVDVLYLGKVRFIVNSEVDSAL
jgi:hypothetical protein